MSSFRSLSLKSILAATCAVQFICSCATAPASALETPAATPNTNDMLVTDAGIEEDRKQIEKVLASIETDWNSHNLDAVMGYYAEDYLNNDGLDKSAVKALTQDFWKTYPDAKSTSTTKEIRLEGPYATVESRDVALGTTAREMPGINTKGELQSVSEGQLYLKKQGQGWKIVGDRIDYERVRVAFGLARQAQATFAAPEQVKAGKQYTARLELGLQSGLTAVGSITNTPLQYPQPQPEDSWRPMNEPSPERPLLERVLNANSKNRNELLMATIGITNTARNSLMGIAFLTRRINVIPIMEDEGVKMVAKSEEKVEKKTDKTVEKEKDSSSNIPPMPKDLPPTPPSTPHCPLRTRR